MLADQTPHKINKYRRFKFFPVHHEVQLSLVGNGGYHIASEAPACRQNLRDLSFFAIACASKMRRAKPGLIFPEYPGIFLFCLFPVFWICNCRDRSENAFRGRMRALNMQKRYLKCTGAGRSREKPFHPVNLRTTALPMKRNLSPMGNLESTVFTTPLVNLVRLE